MKPSVFNSQSVPAQKRSAPERRGVVPSTVSPEIIEERSVGRRVSTFARNKDPAVPMEGREKVYATRTRARRTAQPAQKTRPTTQVRTPEKEVCGGAPLEEKSDTQSGEAATGAAEVDKTRSCKELKLHIQGMENKFQELQKQHVEEVDVMKQQLATVKAEKELLEKRLQTEDESETQPQDPVADPEQRAEAEPDPAPDQGIERQPEPEPVPQPQPKQIAEPQREGVAVPQVPRTVQCQTEPIVEAPRQAAETAQHQAETEVEAQPEVGMEPPAEPRVEAPSEPPVCDPAKDETIDLVTPPSSPCAAEDRAEEEPPAEEPERGAGVGPSIQPAAEPVAKTASLRRLTAPPRVFASLSAVTTAATGVENELSAGVELCPENRFQPLASPKPRKVKVREVKEAEAVPETPSKKRVRSCEPSMAFSKGRSPVPCLTQSRVSQSITRLLSRNAVDSPVPKSADIPKKRTEAVCRQLDVLPRMRRYGFERRVVSLNEVTFRHAILKDAFCLLCEDFASDDKDICYVPVTHGELWCTLPDHLKEEILFKKNQLENFEETILRSLLDRDPELPAKKAANRQSV